MMMRRSGDIACRPNEAGFALPMVLIVLALLTVLAMGLSRMAGEALQDVQLRKDGWTQELAFRSATSWTLYQLLTGTPDKRVIRRGSFVLPLDGSPVQWGGVEIRVQDAAGLMGLGFYNQQAFERLLLSYVDSKQAARVAAVVADWVDGDQRRRYQGMEAADYVKAELPMLPRNAPLRSLDELLEIPGITPQLYYGDAAHTGLRDLLLAGGAGYFNVATAPAALLASVLNLSPEQVAQLLTQRRRGDWSSVARMAGTRPDPFGRSAAFALSGQFRLMLRSADGATARAMYRVIPTRSVPYQMMLWQYPGRHRE